MTDGDIDPTALTQVVELDVPSTNDERGGGQLVAGRYEIVGLIGAGGMGRVYRARDHELDELVALKMLHRELLHDEGLAARFRQEVKLARKVTHRNVARTFDIGEHDGEKFLTMELIEGESLGSTLARRRALDPGDALTIASGICEGMTAAHDAGILHRDLKPDNVLVTSEGRVVITDFGIARAHVGGAAGANEVRRTSGAVVGTPAYMAPEQVLASDEIDARADIYAFGAMLFEMLTGERAWPGNAPLAVAVARLTKSPRDPRTVVPALPEAVSLLVLRCMAPSPSDRYADARALGRALAEARAPMSAHERPAEAPASGPARGRADVSAAVMPFRNAGPPEDDYLAGGITEDLIDTLSMTRGVRVRAARSFDKEDTAGPEEVGRRLGVDVVIEGTVRRLGDRVRVSARLVGVEDGFNIWAARFERPVGAALALNDEVAQAVSIALSAKRDAPQRSATTDPVAIECYLKAKQALARYWMSEDLERPIALLEEAVRRAPDDPSIAAGYALERMRNVYASPETLRQTEPLVRRALADAPELSEVWVALASLRFTALDDVPGAIRAVRRAIATGPSNVDAHNLLGFLLLEAGVTDEAVARLEHCLWLDSSMPWPRVELMRSRAMQGDYDRVHQLFMVRDDAPWRAQAGIAMLRFNSWRRASLDEMMASAAIIGPDVEPRVTLIQKTYLNLIRTGELDAEGRSFIERFAGDPPACSRARRLFSQMGAELHAYAHEDDAAERYMARSVEAGLLDIVWMDQVRLFDSMRGRPEFQRLRGIVAGRAAAVVEAWQGPPEPAGGAEEMRR